VNIKSLSVKVGGLQAYFAARGGIEDAISEIKENIVWGSDDMDDQWNKINETTYYKSNRNVSTSLTHFDYPTRIEVSVIGDPNVETVNIVSKSEIHQGASLFLHSFEATVIKTLSGEVVVIDVKEK